MAPDKDKEVNTLCPVCSSNMTFAGQRYTSRWHGRVVRFLSARCKRTFKRCWNSEEITLEPRTFD